MSPLALYLYAAAVSWSPLASHLFAEASVITRARYESVAEDVASVALDPAEAPLFEGPDGRARTAVLLLAVASLESGGFRGDVAFCRSSGDHGHAWGLYQSHRSPARVCSSTIEATRVALEQMRESFAACVAVGAPALAAYASGDCAHGWLQARNRESRADSWVRAHPLPSPAMAGGGT